MTKNEYIAPIAIPPGETLQDIIDSLNMSQAELAVRTGMSKKVINEIIKGKAPITPETAIKLEYVLGSPASFWNNLQVNYEDTLARVAAQEKMEEELGIATQIPYREMVNNGWVKSAATMQEKIINLRSLLKVSSLSNIENALCVNLRCSMHGTTSIYALAAWIQICTNKAYEINTEPYDAAKLKAYLPNIKELSLEEPEVFIPKLKQIFSSCGVVFIVSPHFSNTKIHGVTKWLTPDKAMIALTLRLKFADIFWFSLFHEIGHVLQHKTTQVFINQDNISKKSPNEEQADKFASEALFPANSYNKLVSSEISRERILLFANTNRVNPCIIIGRLQYNGVIKYSDYSDLKTRYTWR